MLAAGVDWTAVSVAGAFVLGAVVATVAVVKLTGTILEYLRDHDR